MELIENFEQAATWSQPELGGYKGVVLNPGSIGYLKDYLITEPGHIIFVDSRDSINEPYHALFSVEDAEKLAMSLLNQVQYVKRVRDGLVNK